jgi:hypothetical protein
MRHSSTILDLGSKEMCGQLHTPAALAPVPTEQEVRWISLGSREKSLAPAGKQNSAI